MVDIRLQAKNIISANVPKTEFQTSTIASLEEIAVSTANDAERLQQTSEKLYLTNFESSARSSINEITERNKSDPEQLRQQLIESSKGFSENAPIHLRGVIEAQYEIMGRPAINTAIKNRTRINNDLLKESSLKNIAESFKNLEQNASGMLSGDAHVAFDASRSAQLQMNTIENMSQTLDESGLPLFTAEKRVALIEQAKQTLVGSGIKGWFDQQPDKVKAYKDFIEGNKSFRFYDESGEVSVDIDPLFEMNRGTFERTRNYMASKVKEGLVEAQKVQSMAQFVKTMEAGNLVIDPKNKGQRAIVDTYFNEVIAPSIEKKDPEERNSDITDYVAKTGVIPTQVISTVRGVLRNGSIDNQVMAADLISKIQEVSPQALHELDGSDISYGLLLTKRLRGGLSAEEAVLQTKESFNPIQKDIVKRRKEDFRGFEINSKDDIEEAFSTGFFSVFFNTTDLGANPASVDQAGVDYLNAYEEQYVATGDQEVAKQRAIDIINRQYGVTEVSGNKRIIKYPPENYYAVDGLSNEWMTNQLIADVESQLLREISQEDISLVADVETPREISSNKKPGYTVMVKNESGEYIPVQKDGKLMRFFFDSSDAIRKHNEETEIQNQERLIDSKQTLERLRKFELQQFENAITLRKEVDIF